MFVICEDLLEEHAGPVIFDDGSPLTVFDLGATHLTQQTLYLACLT